MKPKLYLLLFLVSITIFATLFQLDNFKLSAKQKVEVEVLEETTSSWDNTPLPNYPDTEAKITILHITIPPNTRVPMHKHPVINAGVLLEGQLTVVREDGKTKQFAAGDSIVELVDSWHYGKNEGTKPAEVIVFYAGTPDTPLTIKKDESNINENGDS